MTADAGISSDSSLFRPEALANKRNKFSGAIIVQTPISAWFFAGIGLLFVAAIVLIVLFGTYSRRVTVKGQLVPAHGLTQVVSPASGTVLVRKVRLDEKVKAGQLIYTVSTERQTGDQPSIQARISNEAGSRQRSLTHELEKLYVLQGHELAAARQKVTNLERELATAEEQESMQLKRLNLAKTTLQRYKTIDGGAFFSASQVQQKEEEVLDQEIRLNATHREVLALQREHQTNRGELQALTLRHVAQVEQLKRGISNAGQELVESESKRNFAIVSPVNGTLVAAYLESGQAVDVSKSAASIIPEGAELVAQIYAPSKSVGMLKAGGRALIRYQSFPFEVYGTTHGTITSISRVALSSSDFNAVGGYTGDASNQGEPIYKVTIAIDKQHVMADGERIELRAGMLLDADLVLEKRHIYQWILAPIYRALSNH